MPDFSQKHTKITTFTQLVDEPDLAPPLKLHSRWERPVLIIPALAAEFTVPENRPIFENIIREISSAEYLSTVIIGLDGAAEEDVHLARRILSDSGVSNYFIQWNDGPGFKGIYEKLQNAGLDLTMRGKGRNLFMTFGTAIALEATSVALIDADIRSFRREQLDKLFFPVLALNYQFSKAYYARWSKERIYGRVKRLLLDPLLLALKRKFTDSQDEKMLRLIDFLLSFHYQLSGEVAIDMDLLKRLRVALNWGIEIFTLIEVYRKANQNQVAQVEFARGAFEHKHQKVSIADPGQGLHRMGIDIVSTLLNALIIEEGLEISETFFRDLAVTYSAIADEMIKKYADNAKFNNLPYDRDREERMVKGALMQVISHGGDIFDKPRNIAERFLRFTAEHPEFQEFNTAGLQQKIIEVEAKLQQTPSTSHEMPSWEWVQEKCPDIIRDIIEVIEGEKKKYGPEAPTPGVRTGTGNAGEA